MRTRESTIHPDRQAAEADRFSAGRLRGRDGCGMALDRNGRDRSALATVRDYQQRKRRDGRPARGRGI